MATRPLLVGESPPCSEMTNDAARPLVGSPERVVVIYPIISVLLGVRRVPRWNTDAYADDRGNGRQERETLSKKLLGFDAIRDDPGPCSRTSTARELQAGVQVSSVQFSSVGVSLDSRTTSGSYGWYTSECMYRLSVFRVLRAGMPTVVPLHAPPLLQL